MSIRTFFTKKRIIWSLIILVIVVGGIYRSIAKKNSPNGTIQTDTVQRKNIEQTVLTTGQVVSTVDLSLSFQASGIIKKIFVKEGDVVREGQTLATLDQTNALANLTSARGTLAQAQANYEKVLAGSSNEQILVAQRTVDAAKKTLENAKRNLDIVTNQQKTAVENAYRTMMSSSLAPVQVVGPYSSDSVTSANAPTISGSYTAKEQGKYIVTQQGNYFSVSGLENQANAKIDLRSTYPLGTRGLFIQFPSDNVSATWEVAVPNTLSALYVTNLNAYQAALSAEAAAVNTARAQVDSAETSLASAEASLSLQQAAARPADISAAKAQILSAQGQVALADAAVNNTVIRAPIGGTITQLNNKVGELATALKEVMVLQDVSSTHIEANVSEANVAALKIGQTIDYTFDALGPDRHFSGSILQINPASTVVSGVVNYKITANYENVPDIKPGMTANITVLVAKKENVLTVQSGAIINRDGKKFVRVVDNPKTKTFHEVEITTGLEADGGLVEVLSGLTEGQEVVTYIKS